MKRIFHIVALTTVLAMGGQALWAQDFEKGLEAYGSGDYTTALEEWRPLAEQGNAYAQFSLGWMYASGEGVVQDYAEAIKWYRKSAEQGDAYAQHNLGWMYKLGKGVTQDYAEAVKWYRSAAEQGHADAQFSLGLMYLKGEGVIQDNVFAHMWFNIAASLGEEGAAENRDSAARRMTPEDISQAQKLARECVAMNYTGC